MGETSHWDFQEGSAIIHSNEQTIFSFSHIEGTITAGKEIREIVGRAINMGMGGIGEAS